MKPDKTGHPLYTTYPDCNGLFTGSVWQGLVFFGQTGMNQSYPDLVLFVFCRHFLHLLDELPVLWFQPVKVLANKANAEEQIRITESEHTSVHSSCTWHVLG